MAKADKNWILPDWPCPASVRALITTRSGGISTGVYASMNVGSAVGDASENVTENRRRLEAVLPSQPRWLHQVHGNQVVGAENITGIVDADASVATSADTVCAVMVADCVPVLLCDRSGQVVAAAHAGWRGLCAGVLENTVEAMRVPGRDLLAYLGPGIGPTAFEVGEEVRTAFIERDPQAVSAFRPLREGKWLADLFMLARQRLRTAGVSAFYGGTDCTYSDTARFFSHRRDKISGRMAALIWLSSS
ncbi:MAG: peptidoglycan editing factor PgeF [Betaproteobacteria bacterium]|nr:MAG: peptidoglycan editing factor PgeF [Betaproteobacteria bacterium]